MSIWVFGGRPEACRAVKNWGIWYIGIGFLSLTWQWGVFNWFIYGALEVEPGINFPYVSWSEAVSPSFGCLARTSFLIMRRSVMVYPYLENPLGLWRRQYFYVLVSILRFQGEVSIVLCWVPFPAGYQVNSKRYHFFSEHWLFFLLLFLFLQRY